MTQNKKPKWDGKSRVSNDLYRKNFEEIFGKGIINTETTLGDLKEVLQEQDELKESYKQSLQNKKEREDNESKTLNLLMSKLEYKTCYKCKKTYPRDEDHFYKMKHPSVKKVTINIILIVLSVNVKEIEPGRKKTQPLVIKN